MDFQEGLSQRLFQIGRCGSWEDQDQPEWTLKVGVTQVTLARFMLECNMDPFSNDNQYLMMNDEEEGDDEMISYWSGDDGNQFLDEVRRDFPNEGKDLYDMTEAMHVWEPLKKEDQLKKDKGKCGKP